MVVRVDVEDVGFGVFRCVQAASGASRSAVRRSVCFMGFLFRCLWIVWRLSFFLAGAFHLPRRRRRSFGSMRLRNAASGRPPVCLGSGFHRQHTLAMLKTVERRAEAMVLIWLVLVPDNLS